MELGISLLVGLLLVILLGSIAAKVWVRQQPPTEPSNEDDALPEPTDEFGIRALSDKTAKYECGHDGPTEYVGVFFGLEMQPSEEALKAREKCPNCIVELMREDAIHCALCGLPIFRGEPVALYGGPKSAFRKEKGWVVKHHGQAVGCVRWGCCPSGGFFAGHWDGKAVHSAFQHGSAAAEALATGKMVVCGDVSDPDSVRHVDIEPEDDSGKQ
jgi:hypothetical protein